MKQRGKETSLKSNLTSLKNNLTNEESHKRERGGGGVRFSLRMPSGLLIRASPLCSLEASQAQTNMQAVITLNGLSAPCGDHTTHPSGKKRSSTHFDRYGSFKR